MRLIDADVLGDVVRKDLMENQHKNKDFRAIHLGEYQHFLRLIFEAPTVESPPNDPLTLAALRDKEGGTHE